MGARTCPNHVDPPADWAARLLELAWWDWPDQRIEGALPALPAADLDGLMRLAP